MATTMDEFRLLLDRSRNGQSLGRGWGIYNPVCPSCFHTWEAYKIIGSKGLRCPKCRFTQREFIWYGALEEPCDGGWLDPIGWQTVKINHN
jgi:hypothetical protein